MLFSKRKTAEHGRERSTSQSNNNEQKLDTSLDKNKALIRSIFQNDETLIIREFQNKGLSHLEAASHILKGWLIPSSLTRILSRPFLYTDLSENIKTDNLLDELKNKVIVSNNVVNETDINKIISSVVSGDTLFLLDGYDRALIISSKGWQSRSISEPESSKVIRGPREGFTESIIVNLTLLRRRIKNPELKFKFKDIGVRTNTKVCISYIEGIAQESIIRELEKRLDDIHIDGILDSGYIQELIRDAPFFSL
jgi:spore germination protein KA